MSGLWLALIGWFILSAAGTELRSTRLQTALEGVRVRDVMTPSPDTAPPDISVGDLIDTYLFEHRHSTFPLTETAGRWDWSPSRGSRPFPPSTDTGRRSARIACPMAEVPVTEPDEPLAALLPRLGTASDGRALVLEDGVLTGIVSPADITRAIDRASLAAAHP